MTPRGEKRDDASGAGSAEAYRSAARSVQTETPAPRSRLDVHGGLGYRGAQMRLVRRLTLYLLLAVGVVFGVDTYLSVRSHLALFDEDVRRDEKLLGDALARAVERVWRQQGEAEAHALLEAMERDADEARIRAVYLDAQPGEANAPEAPQPALEAARREHILTHVRDEGRREARLFTYVPLDVPGDHVVALEVSESLAHERAYSLQRIRSTLLAGALAVLACGAVAWIVGARMVGQPVSALVAKARRIGAGDFSEPLVIRRGDELSQLAREMNSMAAELDAAARKVASESAARLRAVEQLRHADRLSTVGKLASGLAHELGTPLNVVAGRAKMIATGEVESPEEGAESARIIAEQAERMTRIVRQLLDFARRRPSEKRAADLGALARQTVSLLEPLAARRGVSISCAEPSAPVSAPVDASQIQQALTNLVVNAIQASQREHAVTIAVSAREMAPEDARGLGWDGPWALLEVRDQGVGISAEQLPEVFDPFFTTKPVGEGTGLGLSIAHGIAEEHGGWIDVESEPQRGSCFRIWLPRAA
jgi:signal transduction histidine kinase